MKKLIVLLCLFQVSALFAQTMCKWKKPGEDSKLLTFSGSALEISCAITREAYNCQKLENDLSPEEKYKVIKCDKDSIKKNSLSETNVAECVWNGIKISADSFVSLAEMPGKIAESIAKGFKETQACNQSIDKKRELLNAFNLTIQDERFKLQPHFVGRWLEDAPCSEIEKLLSARYQNYTQTLYRERINNINAGKKVEPLKDAKPSINLLEELSKAFNQAEVVYQCYTPKVKAEMLCAGVTSLLVDLASGAGIAGAASKIAAIVKSKKALSRAERALASGNKVDLMDASKLRNADRLKLAEKAMGKTLSEAEKKAILEAHEIGIAEGRGFYTYTPEDLLKKARLLREAGFDKDQVRALMENGITGMFRDPFFKNAMTTHMKKIANMATLSSAQEEALIAIHEIGKSSMAGFSDKAKALLKNAGFKDDQIEKILKAKSNQENGIKTAVEEVKPAPVKVATPAPAKPSVTPPTTPPAAPVTAQVVDSPGRKAVLANYSRDEIYNYKFLEIPDGLTGEALATKQRAKAAHAKDALAKIYKGDKNINIQETIYSNGETVSKAKKFITEYEEKLAKLPAKGADMTKKDLQDKLDRAKTSLEVAQKRCRTIVDLYKVGYGIEQFLRQYEKDFENHCK